MQLVQVTLLATPTQVAPGSVAQAAQVVIQNNAAHPCRVGDGSVSNTKGILLAVGSAPLVWNAPSNLNNWWIQGTAGDVIDVLC